MLFVFLPKKKKKSKCNGQEWFIYLLYIKRVNVEMLIEHFLCSLFFTSLPHVINNKKK